jgi:hypothetical protein
MKHSTADGVVPRIRGRLRLLIVAAGIASVSLSAPVTWVSLDGLHDDYAGLSKLERESRARSLVDLDQDAWRFVRARVQAGDTYAIVTRPGTAGAILRAYAAYSLLPAVQVETPEQADAVFLVGVQARGLEVCADRTKLPVCIQGQRR